MTDSQHWSPLMPLDPHVSIHATRELHDGRRDDSPTKVAIIRCSLPATQDDLWHALTSRERIPEWFLPITGDLEVGGRFQTEGNAGGTVESCDPPHSFDITWEFGEQISWVRVELEPATAGTMLSLIHEAPTGDPTFWETYGPGATGVGWELALLALSVYVDETSDVAPAEVGTWSASAEAHPFIQRVALAWADTAISAGEEPQAAKAAAARTYAFYTGTGEG